MKSIRVRNAKRIIVPAVASVFLFSGIASASEINESTIRSNNEVGFIIVDEQTTVTLEEIERSITEQSISASV
ncbi:hypothetical protein GW626_01605 [Peribacillus muralis]|uniref:hypothetical protein n=1 Tax=Peribacillus muralis TaxID=264697 RepID=UPI001F4E50EC|nr:hypothetical protein [Peribacillus muralis]MCK1994931.1 hypothetical protein [Peribacillus muralis]MCK2015523.1 hypothetical protein [Peribacillus muralis]